MSTNDAVAQNGVTQNDLEGGQDVFLPVEPRDLRRSSTPLTPFSFVSVNSEEPVLSPAAAKMFQHITSDVGVSDMEVKEQRKMMKEARRQSLGYSRPSSSSSPEDDLSTPHFADEGYHSGASPLNTPALAPASPAPAHSHKRSRSLRSLDRNHPSVLSLPIEPSPNFERSQPGLLRRKGSTRTISSSATIPKDGAERGTTPRSKTTKARRISSLLKSKSKATTDDEGYASSSTVAIEGKGGHRARRSMSLWSGEGSFLPSNSMQELQDRYQSQFSNEPIQKMSEKERTEHLRRTRKLVQVFGHEPPQELLHTHRPRERRDSTSTINSLASTNLLNMATSGPHSSQPHQGAQSTDGKPFTGASDAHIGDAHPENQQGAFYERRKRVVKLSRFFGVAAHDIDLPLPELPQQTHDLSTEVKVHQQGHFWSSGAQWKDGRDLDDLRHRLRDLKAS